MTTRGIERAAYIAPHRIVEVNTMASELVCPGARRSRSIHKIAETIREVFALHSTHDNERIEREAESGLRVVNHRRACAVLQLPSRAYPDEVA